MIKTKDNLVGQIFGKLVVLERAEDHIQPSGQRKVVWKCQCSCDNKTICYVSGYNLKNGHTKSCGCLATEKILNIAQNNKENSKTNEAMKNISKDELVEYYRYHTRAETSEYFNITDSVLRNLLKVYNIKKNTQERRYTSTNFVDMTGWIMSEHGVPNSKIQVISFDKIINNQAYWNCLCECGKEFSGNGTKIRSGRILSCGCIYEENIKERGRKLGHMYGSHNKKYNKYDLSNDFGIGYFTNGEEFYFDLEDYDKIKNFYWENNHGYVMTKIYQFGKQEFVYMHRLILDANDNEIIDHIDRNRKNNLRNNLRVTNNFGNSRNASVAKNNTSGFIGVTYDKSRMQWIVQIGVNYKNISLGRFTNKEEAVRVRLEAEAKYFGEFAPQRHLFEEYGIEIESEVGDIESAV